MEVFVTVEDKGQIRAVLTMPLLRGVHHPHVQGPITPGTPPGVLSERGPGKEELSDVSVNTVPKGQNERITNCKIAPPRTSAFTSAVRRQQQEHYHHCSNRFVKTEGSGFTIFCLSTHGGFWRPPVALTGGYNVCCRSTHVAHTPKPSAMYHTTHQQ